MNLTEVEVRILGSLIEKEKTTPESYPLSINSLISACNQKANRAPLMNLTEADVIDGLNRLGYRGLARQTMTGGRVARYRHSLAEKELPPASLAVLAELLLRGPQTAGELRSRGERMTPLSSLAEVEKILQTLMDFGPPLVARLPRRHGQKDQRYSHLLSGMPEFPIDEAPACEPICPQPTAEYGRFNRVAGEVSALRSDIAALRGAIEELKAQFR